MGGEEERSELQTYPAFLSCATPFSLKLLSSNFRSARDRIAARHSPKTRDTVPSPRFDYGLDCVRLSLVTVIVPMMFKQRIAAPIHPHIISTDGNDFSGIPWSDSPGHFHTRSIGIDPNDSSPTDLPTLPMQTNHPRTKQTSSVGFWSVPRYG